MPAAAGARAEAGIQEFHPVWVAGTQAPELSAGSLCISRTLEQKPDPQTETVTVRRDVGVSLFSSDGDYRCRSTVALCWMLSSAQSLTALCREV